MTPREIAAKLTPSQVMQLRRTARMDGGLRLSDGSQTIERLYNLGLVARIRHYTACPPRWPVTEKGLAVLACLDGEAQG